MTVQSARASWRRGRRAAIAATVVASLVAGCATSERADWTFGPAAPSGAGASPAPAASEPIASGDVGDGANAPGEALEITSVDLGFDPSEIIVDRPGTYDVKLVNAGAAPHDITFPDGITTGLAAGGEEKTVTVDVPQGGLRFLCSVPGHADAGMIGSISVRGSTADGGTQEGGDHGGPAPVTPVAADPAAPPPETFDAAAPPLLEGDTHEVELVIEEREMTVAKGFSVRVWDFGGTVPGPVLRVKVGDRIRVVLRNSAENQLPHSIDFHASQVAWNDEMTSIDPGEEKVYEWTADRAGVWMYHCGTAPALHHIANGMYGMVIVEPEGGLGPADHEFALVQSEWYLGAQKEPVSLTRASEAAPAPDFVVFNGVANQYADAPLQVDTGRRVRVFVLNAGPSVDSSFHVVGTIFDRVVKEGVELDPDNAGRWGSQAVDLSPAQGAIVEFTTPEDGQYPFVTHAFNFVGRGALGLFQAGDGDPSN
jgi:nitrite reductase (NO-forming)